LKDSNSPKAETEGAELQVFEAEALKSKLDYQSITKAQTILKKAIDTLEAIPIRSEEQDSVLGEALRTLSLLEPTEPSLARGAILRSLAIFKRLEASQTSNYVLSLDAYSKMLITAHNPIDAEKCLKEAAAEAAKLEGGQDGDLTALIQAEQSYLKSRQGLEQANGKH
jgi:hypothetical protein